MDKDQKRSILGAGCKVVDILVVGICDVVFLVRCHFRHVVMRKKSVLLFEKCKKTLWKCSCEVSFDVACLIKQGQADYGHYSCMDHESYLGHRGHFLGIASYTSPISVYYASEPSAK